MAQLVRAAVDSATIHFDKLYSYAVPPALAGGLRPGSLVLVPFGAGSHPRMAVVLECGRGEANAKLKEVLAAAPDEAHLSEELLQLVHYLHETTFCTWYEAVRAVIPYGAQYKAVRAKDGTPRLQGRLRAPQESVYALLAPLPEKPKPGEKQRLVCRLLGAGALSEEELQKQGVSRAVLKNLVKKGVLREEKRWKAIDLYGGVPQEPAAVRLTEAQRQAAQGLGQLLRRDRAETALLFGVTGSGKTLVFLKLIEEALQQGKKALVLVPEIGLTPQMILRLKRQFGSRVAVQHSALNHSERLLQWKMIEAGGADIVVGTRSAAFAPIPDLGLIIVDEEQEHTYQSQSAPRFDARSVLRLRARLCKALLVFASATPSIETSYQARRGAYHLFSLTERYAGRPLPAVRLVDMRRELEAGNAGEISVALAEELQANLAAGEQSILLLNRRGYRTLCTCRDCGAVLKCPSCSVPLVYHKTQGALLCHYCGKRLPPPLTCPSCEGALRYTGFGTQHVEEELQRLLPGVRVLRMDQDSTGAKHAHEELLKAFAAGKADVLVGTQMVAKGLDFERVSLVGVVGVDNLLYGQGFRAYESVFSLLTQVVGRSGRAQLPGRALIQTVNPDHPVIRLSRVQDYDSFYEQEIAFRELCLYPPFCTVCMVGFVGAREAAVYKAAARFGELLAGEAAKRPQLPLRVLGPAPMGVAMVKDQFRYKLTVKCRGDAAFRALLRTALEAYGAEGLPRAAKITVDCNSDGDF